LLQNRLQNFPVASHVCSVFLQNIKSLLEIPFAKDKPISLMIHRVGKTLLIDEFDIHKHLIRKQKDDWSWLKKFYTEMVLNGEVKLTISSSGSWYYFAFGKILLWRFGILCVAIPTRTHPT